MGEVADEVGFDPRQVLEVLRLAVALVEAGEDAEDLGGALRGHDRVGPREGRDVEGGIGGPPLARIEADQLQLELRRHGHARILQQRGDVVGRAAQHRVLEVDQADPLQPLALGQPDQVGRMVVAQGPGGGRGQNLARGASDQRLTNSARAEPESCVPTMCGTYQSTSSSTSISSASRS